MVYWSAPLTWLWTTPIPYFKVTSLFNAEYFRNNTRLKMLRTTFKFMPCKQESAASIADTIRGPAQRPSLPPRHFHSFRAYSDLDTADVSFTLNSTPAQWCVGTFSTRHATLSPVLTALAWRNVLPLEHCHQIITHFCCCTALDGTCSNVLRESIHFFANTCAKSDFH